MVQIVEYRPRTDTPAGTGQAPSPADPVPDAVGELGRTAQDVGGRWSNYINHDAARQADNHYGRQQSLLVYGDGTQANPGLAELSGEALAQRLPEVRDQLLALRQETAARLPGAQAKRLFDAQADGRDDSLRQQMAQWAAKARVDYARRTDDASMALSAADYGRLAGRDEAGAARAMATYVGAVDNHIALDGAAPDSIVARQARAAAMTSLYGQIAEQRPPAEALTILAAHEQDLQPADFDTLKRRAMTRLQPQIARQAVMAPADQDDGAVKPTAPPRYANAMVTVDEALETARAQGRTLGFDDDQMRELEAATRGAWVEARGNLRIAAAGAWKAVAIIRADGGGLADIPAEVRRHFSRPDWEAVQRFFVHGHASTDAPAAAAAVQAQLAGGPDDHRAFIDASPVADAADLTQATHDRMEAHRQAGRQGAPEFQAAVNAARLAETVAAPRLAAMDTHPNSPAGQALRAGVGERIRKFTEENRRNPTLKEAGAMGDEQAAQLVWGVGGNALDLVSATEADAAPTPLAPGEDAPSQPWDIVARSGDDQGDVVRADWRPGAKQPWDPMTDYTEIAGANGARAEAWARKNSGVAAPDFKDRNWAYNTSSTYLGYQKQYGGKKGFDPSADGVGADKCNFFIADMLLATGASRDAVFSGFHKVWGAKQWADAKLVIPTFVIVTGGPLMPGDIIASAHGHVGVFALGPKREPGIISGSSGNGVRWAPWPWSDQVAERDFTVRRQAVDQQRLEERRSNRGRIHEDAALVGKASAQSGKT